MGKPLTCRVCAYYRTEIERVIRDTGLEGHVELRAFPGNCQGGLRGQDHLLPRMSLGQISAWNSPSSLVIGGCAIDSPSRAATGAGRRGPASVGCFGIIAPDWLTANLAAEGGYLISPGWLADWEDHVAGWGFKPEDLKDFARESMRRLCLLDTLIHEDSEAKLSAMSEALGVPAIRIPLGLEHCRHHVETLIRGRLDSDGSAQAADGNAKQVADYAMALDFLAQLNFCKTEPETIAFLLDTFSMLFAASRLSLLRYEKGKPFCLVGRGGIESAMDAETLALCSSLSNATRPVEHGEGLAVPLDFRGGRLALLLLDGFALPERRNAYRNLLESVAPICSLALENARNYEELERDEKELRRRQGELVGMLGVRDRLFSIVGHDLRGPIGSMRDLIGILHDSLAPALDADQRRLLHEMRSAMEQAYFLLVNLLDWGRLQQSRIEIRPEPLDILSMAEHGAALLGAQASAKGVIIRIDIDQGLRPMADRNTLETVLRNLLSNALKFTPRGGHIRLEARRDEGGVRITVADNGVGMDAATLSPPSGLSTGRSLEGTEGERGTGLGLILCREFMGLNGGTMRTESAPGRGTTVTLSLPDKADGPAS